MSPTRAKTAGKENASPSGPVTTYRAHILTPSGEAWAHWKDGRLDVGDGRIVSVGPWRRTPHYVDLRPHFVLPGLVDTHAHVPQLPICGVHPESLLEWLRKWTFPLERRFRGSGRATCRAASCRRCSRRARQRPGSTRRRGPTRCDACFEAAEEVGIHAWIGPPLMDDGAYRQVTTRKVLDEAWRLADLDRPRLRFAVTPRFALSCTRELLRECGTLAREKQLPIQTHLAEQRAECEVVRAALRAGVSRGLRRRRAPRPAQPVRARHLADRTRLAPPRRVGDRALPHVERLPRQRGDELGARAGGARGTGLGRGRGARPLDVPRRPDGVDRALAERHARSRRRRLLRTATVGGARALGFDDVGSLEQGKAADFIVLDAAHIVPPGAPTAESTDDLLSRILHRGGRSAVRQVYVERRAAAPQQESGVRNQRVTRCCRIPNPEPYTVAFLSRLRR